MKVTKFLALLATTLLTTSVVAQPIKLEKAEPVNAKALTVEAAKTIALTMPTVALSFNNTTTVEQPLLAANTKVKGIERDKKATRVIAE